MTTKRYLLAVTTASVLLVYSGCHKPTATTAETPTNKTALSTNPLFHKAIGAPVPRATTQGWKQRYRARYRLRPYSYQLSASGVKELLGQWADVVCIAFYWVQTAQGLDFLPLAIDKSGTLVATATVKSLKGQVWSWAAAKQLRDQYSGPTRANIFGLHTFERLIVEGTDVILIEPAINGQGEDVLVLSNTESLDSGVDQDNSIRCPTLCPKEDPINF